MANRKFDTYMPGASEQLESFLDSVMSGRYIFFVIKVHKNFHVFNHYAEIVRANWEHNVVFKADATSVMAWHLVISIFFE